MRRIVQGRRGVTVYSDRLNVKAKRVIVAVPPILTGKIDYEPGLPDERVELIDHYPQGTLTKAACVYDRPFWRDDGLTGQVLYTDGPDRRDLRRLARGRQPGDRLRLHRRRRRARLLEALQEAAPPAGDRQLRQLLRAAGGESRRKYVESAWKCETWTRGCPVGIPGPRPDRRPRRGAGRSRSAASTGPAPRPPTTGPDTWTAPCARASAPRPRSSSGSDESPSGPYRVRGRPRKVRGRAPKSCPNTRCASGFSAVAW